jgi:hypothetical protein
MQKVTKIGTLFCGCNNFSIKTTILYASCSQKMLLINCDKTEDTLSMDNVIDELK